MAWLLDKEIKRELPEEWKGIVPTEVFIKKLKKWLKKPIKRA